MTASFSPLESRRFGLSIHRFKYDNFDAISLEEILSARPDIAILRIPAQHLYRLRTSVTVPVEPIIADTLVYYSTDLTCARYLERRNSGLVYRTAVPEDYASLESLVRSSFIGYINHYSANKFFPPAKVLEGFVEWGLGFLTARADTQIWVADRSGTVIAFAACRHVGTEIDIVLNSVHPDAAGQGIYGDLIGYVLEQSAGRFSKASISTQIHNYQVQRAWQKRGFLIDHAYNTIHLNLFLGLESMVDEGTLTFKCVAELRRDLAAKVKSPELLIQALAEETHLGEISKSGGRAIIRSGHSFRQIVIEDTSGSIKFLRNVTMLAGHANI